MGLCQHECSETMWPNTQRMSFPMKDSPSGSILKFLTLIHTEPNCLWHSSTCLYTSPQKLQSLFLLPGRKSRAEETGCLCCPTRIGVLFSPSSPAWLLPLCQFSTYHNTQHPGSLLLSFLSLPPAETMPSTSSILL